MFQFPGFAFVPYVFRNKYLLVTSAIQNAANQRQSRKDAQPKQMDHAKIGAAEKTQRLEITEVEGGFPHSEIHGSKPVRGSP